MHLTEGKVMGGYLIQSDHGQQGNFEVVVPAPHGGGLAQYVRENDNNSNWVGPFCFGKAKDYVGASFIQSNYGSTGNLEMIALTAANDLDFTWRMDTPPWTWDGLHRIGSEAAFPVAECVYSWDAAYLQLGTHVVIRIQHILDPAVDPATLAALQTTWRTGIINKWSNIFDCTAPNGDRRPLTFDVEWVNSDAHHLVQVIPGPARSNMTSWDTSDTGAVASHEFGHMLGHSDEYPDPACPTRSPVNTGTVMHDNTETVSRHYQRIAGAHCGHNPSPDITARSTFKGEATKMQFLDELDPDTRSATLARFRALADPAAGPDASAVVSFEISGGVPGERYHYRVQIAADGAAEQEVLDGLAAMTEPPTHGVLTRKESAQVFAAVDSVGLLTDQRPRFAAQQRLGPDSLVVTIRLRQGNLVRQVSIPAREGAQLPKFAEIPLPT
jgi:hypothetical protein